MTPLLSQLALLVAAAAVLTGAAVLLATRSMRTALPVLLDLLLAAGLLHLAAADSWRAIATAAAIVVIRKVVAWTLTGGGPADHRDHRAHHRAHDRAHRLVSLAGQVVRR